MERAKDRLEAIPERLIGHTRCLGGNWSSLPTQELAIGYQLQFFPLRAGATDLADHIVSHMPKKAQ